jgi:hypothetical protein
MAVIINGTTGITCVNGSAAAPSMTGADTDTGIVYGTNTLSLVTGGTERVVVDSSGNLGLGVTPSAWATLTAMQVKNAALGGYGLGTYLGSNVYYSGGWNRISADVAGLYQIGQGAGGVMSHQWYVAGTGSAGSAVSFTQAMTLDANANLGVGAVPDALTFPFTSGSLQFVGGNSVYPWNNGGMYIQANAYFNSGWKYKNTSTAGQFVLANDGSIAISRAVSGTAGNAITWIQTVGVDSTGNFQFNSGYGSTATAYGCRAWVNFNGQGTVAIRASGNVSSITDSGTGNWGVNFTSAMPDTNYSTHYTPGNNNNATYYTAAFPSTTSQVVVWNYNGSAQVDTAVNSVAIFR